MPDQKVADGLFLKTIVLAICGAALDLLHQQGILIVSFHWGIHFVPAVLAPCPFTRERPRRIA